MDRTALIASLGHVEDTDHLHFADDDRYIDWSCRRGDSVQLELGDGSDAAAIELSRAELVELHKRLTLWLLAND